MKYLYIFAFISLGFLSCEEETGEAIVLTEDVLYVTGERVRLSGRIYDNGGLEVSDHGFEIATDDSFNSVVANISLGASSRLGQFIGYNDVLDMGTQYYYRAFMVNSQGKQNGQTKKFNTLETRLTSYSPMVAYPGDKLEIIGTNFTSDTKVFFGNTQAEIINIELESIIEVVIPPIKNLSEVVISVEIDNEKISFEEKFEYVFGEWNKYSEFEDNYSFVETLGFQLGDKYVLGLGINQSDLTLNPSVWELDFMTDIWTSLAFSGTLARYPFSNNEGYFGGGVIGWSSSGGLDETPIFNNEFWRYENGTFNSLGSLPFQLYGGVSFINDGDLYVTGGRGPSVPNKIMYKYDIANGVWSLLGDLPFTATSNLSVLHHNGTEYLFSDDGVLWSLNYDSMTWSQVTFYPEEIRQGGIATIIGDRLYIGLFNGTDKIWEYDLITKEWKQKVKMEDYLSNKNSGYYVNDSKLYVIRATPLGSEESKMTVWEFDPNKF